jgi:prepilin-type N-terminal cleavage/methylation domain-containing protein/prepilin-type processing-associated H-X9-DG protein
MHARLFTPSAKPNMQSPPRSNAFTLIELLVVITIIAVLAGLLLPVFSTVQNRTSSIKSVANLKQLGACIQSYMNDNNAILPGPLWGAQSGTYVRGVTVSYSAQPAQYAGGSLLVFLGPYLGNPVTSKTAYTDCFMYPAFIPYAQKNATAPDYIVSDISATGVASATTSGLNEAQNPWGYAQSPAGTPKNMAEVSLFCLSLANTWAISELDQQLVGINSGDGWYSEIPPSPVHRNGRNALFFDWHVARMDAKGNSL